MPDVGEVSNVFFGSWYFWLIVVIAAVGEIVSRWRFNRAWDKDGNPVRNTRSEGPAHPGRVDGGSRKPPAWGKD